MGWADKAISQLRLGETVTIRPRGNSMLPHIRSGAVVEISPYAFGEGGAPVPKDIVLCRVSGNQYLHFIEAMRGPANKRQYQIANARGRVNGWIGRNNIFGKVVKIDGKERK